MAFIRNSWTLNCNRQTGQHTDWAFQLAMLNMGWESVILLMMVPSRGGCGAVNVTKRSGASAGRVCKLFTPYDTQMSASCCSTPDDAITFQLAWHALFCGIRVGSAGMFRHFHHTPCYSECRETHRLSLHPKGK